jgi:hypothetical protein
MVFCLCLQDYWDTAGIQARICAPGVSIPVAADLFFFVPASFAVILVITRMIRLR